MLNILKLRFVYLEPIQNVVIHSFVDGMVDTELHQALKGWSAKQIHHNQGAYSGNFKDSSYKVCEI